MPSRDALIKQWYDWNNAKQRQDYHHDARQEDGWLMTFMGSRISNANATETIATFVRRETIMFVHADGHGERSKWAGGARGDDTLLPPLVRLPLPNVLTIGRHRAISRVVRAAGGQAVAVSNRVLQVADIVVSSIVVIDTEKRPRGSRAPQQLIRAKVSSIWIHGTRWSYFLSGYDLNEPGLSYFFCELPPDAMPSTIEEAYQMLKPESVKVAEAQRKKVKRQGDIFLIPVDTPPGGEGPLIKKGRKPDPWDWDYILGTNHMAEDRIVHRNLTYVRGRIVHAPSGRRPDHQPLRLGRQWHLAVKNTVPVVGR
jgi:hypothetical protein